eukprot:evm.model.scf_723.2 EVM.evm.TU.scf_723.2   scf_723:8387-14026(+)
MAHTHAPRTRLRGPNPPSAMPGCPGTAARRVVRIRQPSPHIAVLDDRPQFVGRSRCREDRVGPRRLAGAAESPVSYSRDMSSTPRLIQHKNEAFWFYRYLSIVYDKIVNPGHWTVDMRDDALLPANLDSPELKVVDVGGGTGFCTLGIVKTVDPTNVTLVDQSPHQMSKAKQKKPLEGVTFTEGDAEDIPLETDAFDRYVSAGSIEYWPDPQRGICEAYRVVKPGGLACLIGPVHPTHWLSRFFADMWMLFPTEEEYIEWFTKAGFEDVKMHRIGPKWYRGVRRHGLIMGCSVTGRKSKAGVSPLNLGPVQEISKASNTNSFSFLFRLILGSTAGFYYFILPIYMWLKNKVWPKDWEM